jgi:hypothetical protein
LGRLDLGWWFPPGHTSPRRRCRRHRRRRHVRIHVRQGRRSAVCWRRIGRRFPARRGRGRRTSVLGTWGVGICSRVGVGRGLATSHLFDAGLGSRHGRPTPAHVDLPIRMPLITPPQICHGRLLTLHRAFARSGSARARACASWAVCGPSVTIRGPSRRTRSTLAQSRP